MAMRSIRLLARSALAVAGIWLAIGGTAWATPAFARREGVTCQACHFRVPELNLRGLDYARRGLRWKPPAPTCPPDKTEPAEPKPTLGEPLALQWSNYLSVLGHQGFNATRLTRPLFDAGAVEFWLGGPLDDRWTAFVVPTFDIQNGGSGVDQGYGQFITRWADTYGSARFGQVQPFAIFFNQGGPSMSISTPVVLSQPADTGTSWTPASLFRGLELGCVSNAKWNAYFGAGQPRLDSPTFDPNGNQHVDFYASAEGIFNAKGDSLTAYGYWGQAVVSDVATDEPFHRWGFFGNYYLGQTKLVAGVLTGSDNIPGATLDNSGYFVQAETLFTNHWAGYARYDGFMEDLAVGGSQHIEGPTVGFTWWPLTPVRLTLEGQFLQTTGQPRDSSVTFEFDWWF
jgi:hypothetical protein